MVYVVEIPHSMEDCQDASMDLFDCIGHAVPFVRRVVLMMHIHVHLIFARTLGTRSSMIVFDGIRTFLSQS